MRTFLEDLAEEMLKAQGDLEANVVVVPNRRAALFVRKYISEKINRPVFSPTFISIEDFIASHSKLKLPDKLELINILYTAYHEMLSGEEEHPNEPFEQFYFWGDMLLRDFEEVDRYMVDAKLLFRDLSHQKELDASFDYLTSEQQAFLEEFWSHFRENITENKKRFLNIWKKLPDVYYHFREKLQHAGYAYGGMQHRLVAENLSTINVENGKRFHFAGFNALTKAEELIFAFFIEHHGARMTWDMDQYYVNNETQEAGRYFREYQEHPVFRRTFPADIPANFSRPKSVKLYGAAQPIGQVKLMSQIVADTVPASEADKTLIVLPDEKLLIPVLHGIADTVEKLNVTMGFPLASTPLFNLIELLADLQISRKDDCFNHRQTLAVLGHPYVVAADPVSSHNKRKEILKHNWVHIPWGFLASENELHRIMFVNFEDDLSPAGDNTGALLIHYLKRVVTVIGSLRTINDVDKEYALHFLKLFNRIETVLYANKNIPSESGSRVLALKSFLRLFRQLVRSERLPFSGEPLKGLQIMGVLETRNLDFKNVFILSLNEGAFPAAASKGSYIPFNIRRAYNLPTPEHQDAIYAYLFYRVLQRAENIHLFYNSETDVLGQGEMSRYLQQFIYESGIKCEHVVLDNPVQPMGINPIVVQKNNQVMEDLFKLNDGNIYFKGISPSALNAYIECRLKFYFRHVAKIKEPNEVEEELDARVLGNFLHGVMERFYKDIYSQRGDRLIQENDFQGFEEKVDNLIDKLFIEAYRLDGSKKVVYQGQRLVVREIVRRFAHRIIEIDRSYAPFVIEALEQEGVTFTVPLDKPPFRAVIGGKIDRVDRKDDLLRIIDYKTGKDKMNFETIASLFARDENRNKAAFQTFVYALLYRKNFLNNGKAGKYRVVPGLINRLNLFDENFSFGLQMGKETITDAVGYLDEFEASLKLVLEELFDPEVPFDQTRDLMNCKFCPYGQICYR
jgi:CRISPR/Cas system-associated exonuclease Cas4 (RecB family)